MVLYERWTDQAALDAHLAALRSDPRPAGAADHGVEHVDRALRRQRRAPAGLTVMLEPVVGWPVSGQMMRCMDIKLELVILPVTDVDRAKAFYVDQLGFNADHDHTVSDEVRFVQLTPPGSACSIAIGTGLTDAVPGSVRGMQAVSTTPRRPRELAGRGVTVSDVEVHAVGRLRPPPGSRRQRLGPPGHPVALKRRVSPRARRRRSRGRRSAPCGRTSRRPGSTAAIVRLDPLGHVVGVLHGPLVGHQDVHVDEALAARLAGPQRVEVDALSR